MLTIAQKAGIRSYVPVQYDTDSGGPFCMDCAEDLPALRVEQLAHVCPPPGQESFRQPAPHVHSYRVSGSPYLACSAPRGPSFHHVYYQSARCDCGDVITVTPTPR